MNESRSISDSNLIRHSLLVIFLGSLSLLIYSNTFHASFHMDDWLNIQENPYCHIETISARTLFSAAFKGHSFSRPVSNLTFALNYYFGGLDVFGYHLVNLVIHILAGVVVYFLVYVLLGLPSLKDEYGRYRFYAASLTAIFFVCHPVQTQAVTYIVQRMTSLAALFYLLCILFYILGRTQSGKMRGLSYIFSVLSGLLAIGSKETSITLPLFILLVEYLFFAEQKFYRIRGLLAKFIIASFFLAVVALFFLWPELLERLHYLVKANAFGTGTRLLTESRVVFYYLSLLFFPIPSRLNLDHDYSLSMGLLDPPTTILSVGLFLLLMGYGVYAVRKKRVLHAFCIFWYFGNLVVESTVIPLALIYEHRVYLPSVGVFLLIQSFLFHREFPFRRAAWLVLLIPCTIFSVFTYQRNSVWQDEASLWSDVVKKSPNLARPHDGLGVALLGEGRYAEAEREFRTVIRMDPSYSDGYGNLGNIYRIREEYDQAEAFLTKKIELAPREGWPYAWRGEIYFHQARYEEAYRDFSTALRFHFGLIQNPEFRKMLDASRQLLLENYQAEIRKDPENMEALFQLGILYTSREEYGLAQEQFQRILKSDPNHIEALNNLGAIFLMKKNVREAETCFRHILELDPNHFPALMNLGRICMARNQRQEAQEYLLRAKRIELERK